MQLFFDTLTQLVILGPVIVNFMDDNVLELLTGKDSPQCPELDDIARAEDQRTPSPRKPEGEKSEALRRIVS